MIQWFGFNIGLFLRYRSCSLFLLLFCMNITFQMGKNSWTILTLSFSLVKSTQRIKNNPQFKCTLIKYFSSYFVCLDNKKLKTAVTLNNCVYWVTKHLNQRNQPKHITRKGYCTHFNTSLLLCKCHENSSFFHVVY